MHNFRQKYSIDYDHSEVSKCLLCHEPTCTKACPQHADVGDILRSLYFRNYSGAVRKINCDCTYCNAPCESACVLSGRKEPVAIRDLLLSVKSNLKRNRVGSFIVLRVREMRWWRLRLCANPPSFVFSPLPLLQVPMTCAAAPLWPDGPVRPSKPSAVFRSTRLHRVFLPFGIIRMRSAGSKTLSSFQTTVSMKICRFFHDSKQSFLPR